MTLAAAVMQSCSMCFGKKCLRSAIVLEAKRGYRNAMVGNMRFNHLLFSNISKLFFRAKHKFAEKLMKEVDGYEATSIFDHPRLLNKVSVWMGYDGLDDLVDKENAKQEFLISIKGGTEDFDVSLACKQFPSITLGCSSPVELYDEATYRPWNSGFSGAHFCEEFLPSPIGTNWADLNQLYKSQESLNLKLANDNSSALTEDDCGTSSTCSREDTRFIVDKSFSSVEHEPQQDVASVELILDRTIGCIPGLSKRQFGQLENCGFYTLRKLLHHFPRTYADLRNADVGIEDGRYLIFAGKILSSRWKKEISEHVLLEACSPGNEVLMKIDILSGMKGALAFNLLL